MSKEQAVVWHQLLVKTKTSDERFFLVVVVQLFMCGPRNATMIYHWFKGYFFFLIFIERENDVKKNESNTSEFSKDGQGYKNSYAKRNTVKY